MHVYLITNKVNGKLYVGQHCGSDLPKYLQHNIKHAMRNQGNKTFLYHAIRKYGPDAFDIRSIHLCKDKEEMDKAEKAYIKFFGTRDPEIGYNLTDGGGGRLGTKSPHTPEWKLNMSNIMKGRKLNPEWKKKIGDAQRGRPLTEKHRKALSVGQRGKSKGIRSTEHCEKIRQRMIAFHAKRKQEAMVNAG